MRLSHIGYFLVLCEELNFTRAARRCKIAQPSLSGAIQSLERELGGQLFNRGKPMSMTEFGENARPHLQRAFASVEKARAWRARREKQHRASTAAPPELMQDSPAE